MELNTETFKISLTEGIGTKSSRFLLHFRDDTCNSLTSDNNTQQHHSSMPKHLMTRKKNLFIVGGKSASSMRRLIFQYMLLALLSAQKNTATAAELSAAPSKSKSDSTGILKRALKADTVELRSGSDIVAWFDEVLKIPKCSLEGSSCDTGDLVSGRGKIDPEPNYPNTLYGTDCTDGTSGGASDESVDRIIISSESGGYMTASESALITAIVWCWADDYANDYVYFYYASDASNPVWNLIGPRQQCPGGGQQNLTASYTLPQGEIQAVRVSIRHIEDSSANTDGSCGLGPFDDNDDVAFTVAAFPQTTATPDPMPTSPSPPVSPPTPIPTRAQTQTLSPTESPFVLFSYGESLVTDPNLSIQISDGLTAKRIAQAGTKVTFASGGQSSRTYHRYMDAAGVTTLPDGGYVYVSNSEDYNGKAGVFGLYFNKDGEIIDYKALLTGTTWNCGGGLSPWQTWISCEETSIGQCWQVEPNPASPNHNSPNITLLGGDGGNYESVAVDNRNPQKPTFFTTEDNSYGELRRFEADGNGWDALHSGGQTTYLQFLDGNRFQWTTSLSAGKNSAANYYPNVEGIAYHNSTLYFVSKVTRRLYILALNDMTYTSERVGSSWVGQGSFNSQPDQIIENDLDIREFIYFTEDGGNSPGVHVRDREGKYYTMVRAIPGGKFSGDETVGIAFSPDRKKFYFGFQDAGVLMEVTRNDGREFN
jgi:hypothetical protein